MFEITGNDIAQLNDEDLRSLIGRLCESEAKRHGLPTSCVTWGGDQRASDGGVDVRVALPAQTPIEGFIPRAATVFQTKADEIPPSGIASEMRPKGIIRPAITELARISGGYIIVGSKSPTADPALQSRRDAMRMAVRDVPNAAALFLDFYDRGRIATWVRDHSELIPWVRERIGRSIQGWRPYGVWADPSEEPKAEYLMDAGLRLLTGRQEDADGLDAVKGINRIRSVLSEPRTAVRLIGLSGVGKTRFVQALFDERVGDRHLDPSLAVYTDMSDEPNPAPVALATDLVANQARQILVVDNCSPDLHGRLTKPCRSLASKLSVITIEFDIQDDEPEGTQVFRLEPSSTELVEKLIKRRFPHVSSVDAQTVAEFSGGNARIAVALATTIGKNESIAGIPDAQLFDRLFRQRQPHDKSLRTSAEVCSLVYSFQVEEGAAGAQGELAPLGTLVKQDAQEVYANVAELQRRGLAQQRSVWRAVLPQAIANRLAASALQNIPPNVIDAQFLRDAPGRLLKSFSKRLGYLHGSKEATAIVRKWLGVGGILSDVPNLNDQGKAIFNNVAPAAPEAALSAIERALLGQDDEALRTCTHVVRLLRLLAYDAALFDRCTALILKIASAGDVNQTSNEATDAFVSLFPIVLSGTHASIEQRLRVIERLLTSEDSKHRTLGVAALKVSLEAWHFMSHYEFAFGAHSRDFGYQPRSRVEEAHWFGSTINLAESLACSDRPCASGVRSALAEKFRGLWTKAGMYDALEHVCRAISEKQFWKEGWIAVRQALNFDSKGFASEISARLSSLEELLRPKDLVQKVRSMVFSKRITGAKISEFWDGDLGGGPTDFDRLFNIAKKLGAVVASDAAAFEELLPEMVTLDVSGNGRVWHLGSGMFDGEGDSRAKWDRLVAQLAATPEDQRNIEVLRGFLAAAQEKDPAVTKVLLDDAVQNETLARWYPALESSVRIDDIGVNRLKRSLAFGRAPIGAYRSLAAGVQSIADKDVRDLLLDIATKPDGLDVAIELLSMRLHGKKADISPCGPEILDVGCQLLRQLTFSKRQKRDDYSLQVVAKACLLGQEGAEIVRAMCHNLRDADSKFKASAFDYALLIEGLFAVQPTAALDGLLTGSDREVETGCRIIHDVCLNEKNPVDLVPEEVLID